MNMQSRTSWVRGLCLSALMVQGMALSALPSNLPPGVKGVTAIAEVFGDGLKVSALAIEYDRVIDTSRLKPGDFSVASQTVTRVYGNTQAARASKGINGSFVIVEVSTAMDKAPARPGPGPGAGGPPPGAGGPKLGDQATDSPQAKPLTASVTQVGDIYALDGKVIRASSLAMANSAEVDLVVQDFQQFVYKDPKFNGEALRYNLFVPKGYDPAKKYPLVLFIHDAGVVSNNPTATLTQGLGAVIWASPEDQAQRPCFVLAPQYDRVIVDDSSKPSEQMDITVDLIRDLEGRYSIDPRRLYSTGQSMGGMISIGMDIKYPKLFAASLLVACQWDTSKVEPMAGKALWIIVCEGDTKAKPGMDAITSALGKLGTQVRSGSWPADSEAAVANAKAQALAALGGKVNYTVFPGGDHQYTWRYAYSVEAVRAWIFSQTGSGED